MGGLRELCGTIVIHLGCREGTIIARSFELAARVELDHYLVSGFAGVLTPSGVFSLVVLEDTVLFSLLDALPVSLEGDVEEGIASEH